MQKGVLIILDGYGEGKRYRYNAVSNAKTPTLHALRDKSYSILKAHGDAVGIFDDEMGGSEVGHMTIGAGRPIPCTVRKIRDDLLSGEFKNNKVLVKTLNDLEKNQGDLHLFGLMSDKNVHSNIYHCFEIIDLAKDKVKNIFIHFVTDGRDCGMFDSLKYLQLLQKKIKNIKNCHILSVSGRAIAMDRENRMEFTNSAFNAMFGQNNTIVDIKKYIQSQHDAGNNDQYVQPVSVKSSVFKGVSKKDCLLFFNFREDRLRQIVKRCEELPCKLVTMGDVENTRAVPIYSSKDIKHTLSEYLSKKGLKQIKISETTKYAHVTYFFNGGREKPFEGEDRIHIPTIKTNNYAKTPKMQAKKIAIETVKSIKKGYDAVIVNFSNPDMVGHTGDYNATVKSLEFMDKCVNKVIKMASKKGYFVLLTADHGNSEQMTDKNDHPQTAHTINPVMCVVANADYEMKKQGSLQDVAPTFIDLLGLEPNKHFDGESLIIK